MTQPLLDNVSEWSQIVRRGLLYVLKDLDGLDACIAKAHETSPQPAAAPQGDTSLSAHTVVHLTPTGRRHIAALLAPPPAKQGPTATWLPDPKTAQQAMSMAAESDTWGH